MKLVVGLGNPGRSYRYTRHNMGFLTIDKYLENKEVNSSKKKFNGEYYQVDIDGEQVIFLKPLSYMNLSGVVVRQFVDYFKIAIEDVLIIHDDLDTNFGLIKIKKSGTSAGHNGLQNIEDNLKTKEYKRIKIGISKNGDIDKSDYVLQKLNKEEKKEFEELSKELVSVLDDYFLLSFDNLMNKYNKKQEK